METLKIATAQFENRSGDKSYNLNIMESLSTKAANEGAKIVYTLLQNNHQDATLSVVIRKVPSNLRISGTSPN